MKNKKGFTLVELLVVIAIIGILSSVAIVNLNSAREKAKAASVQAALSQITSAAILCMDENEDLSNGTSSCNGSLAPTPGEPVCTNSSADWPAVESNDFGYNTNCDSDKASDTWFFSASTTGTGSVGVACDNTGCRIIP